MLKQVASKWGHCNAHNGTCLATARFRMFPRRTLGWPITLGVVMIVLVVALAVTAVLLRTKEQKPEENSNTTAADGRGD